MYDHLFEELDNLRSRVNTFKTVEYHPTPRWFDKMDWFKVQFASRTFNTSFGRLLHEKFKCEDSEHPLPGYDSSKRQEILNELVAEFKRIHIHADTASDSILKVLDEIETLVKEDNLTAIEPKLQHISDLSWKYEYLCGICDDFANELSDSPTCQSHFYDGAYNFYANGDKGTYAAYDDVHRWIKRFRYLLTDFIPSPK